MNNDDNDNNNDNNNHHPMGWHRKTQAGNLGIKLPCSETQALVDGAGLCGEWR